MRTAEHYALNPFFHCNSRVTRVLGRHLGGSEDAPQSGAAARLFLFFPLVSRWTLRSNVAKVLIFEYSDLIELFCGF